MVRIKPGSRFFVGRTETIAKLLESIRRDSAVLLYGGRQSGKTSVLLALSQQLSAPCARASELAVLDVPVYIDLTTLHYDATPLDFFGLLIVSACEALAKQIEGFVASEYPPTLSLTAFVESLSKLRARCGEVDARPVFLLDEAKRVLGSRFPRGFQDNLFSILYGGLSEATRCAIVFTGAQRLNDFAKDDTSPIGSRAGTVVLEVLGKDAVRDLVRLVLPVEEASVVEQVAAAVASFTGGHAGTAAKLLEGYSLDESHDIGRQAELFYERSFPLFENWSLSFSAEASTIADALVELPRMSIAEIAAQLQSRGLQRYLARRATEELQYTGVAVWDGECLQRCNDLYWRFMKECGSSRTRTPSDADFVWQKIEQTELSLRQLVERKLVAKFGDHIDAIIIKILGQDAWDAILRAKQRGSSQYKFSPGGAGRDLMSCMYLGQLGALMVSRETWDLFKEPYRDKRELEDRLAAIAPVRTDRAHFVAVPQKELDRCRIACDDLAVIVEREIGKLES